MPHGNFDITITYWINFFQPLIMGYRQGYYKKDGTYVQGHFYSSSRKRPHSDKKSKKGCTIILLLISLGFTIILSK